MILKGKVKKIRLHKAKATRIAKMMESLRVNMSFENWILTYLYLMNLVRGETAKSVLMKDFAYGILIHYRDNDIFVINKDDLKSRVLIFNISKDLSIEIQVQPRMISLYDRTSGNYNHTFLTYDYYIHLNIKREKILLCTGNKNTGALSCSVNFQYTTDTYDEYFSY